MKERETKKETDEMVNRCLADLILDWSWLFSYDSMEFTEIYEKFETEVSSEEYTASIASSHIVRFVFTEL